MFPEASLRTWMPAIHAGKTKLAFSFSVGERKIMERFVVNDRGGLPKKSKTGK